AEAKRRALDGLGRLQPADLGERAVERGAAVRAGRVRPAPVPFLVLVTGRQMDPAVDELDRADLLGNGLVVGARLGAAELPGVTAVVAVDDARDRIAVLRAGVDAGDQQAGVLTTGELDAVNRPGGVPAPVRTVDGVGQAHRLAPLRAVLL